MDRRAKVRQPPLARGARCCPPPRGWQSCWCSPWGCASAVAARTTARRRARLPDDEGHAQRCAPDPRECRSSPRRKDLDTTPHPASFVPLFAVPPGGSMTSTAAAAALSDEAEFDESSTAAKTDTIEDPRTLPVQWFAMVPFWGAQLVALGGVIAGGWSWKGFGLALGLYAIRMFGLTAGYHRYFSHRSYRTSRPFQFLLALLGSTATQKGVLW